MRVIRIINCDLTTPKDLAEEITTYSLCWMWMCSGDKDSYKVEPCQGMYDFGLDEEVPLDWLIWPEEVKTTPGDPIRDFTILQQLGVRGMLIINDVGTLDFENWQLNDEGIAQYKSTLQFSTIPTWEWRSN